MQRRKSNTNGKMEKFLAYFKRNWLGITIILSLLLFVLPVVINKVQDFIRSLKENKLENETKLEETKVVTAVKKNNSQNSNSSEASLKKKASGLKAKYKGRNIDSKLWLNLENDAHNIAVALGTDAGRNKSLFGFDFFSDRPDVDAFFEDEKEALRIAKKYPRTFDILADLYYTTATRSKSLRTDLLSLLDKSQITELRNYYKKHIKTQWL